MACVCHTIPSMQVNVPMGKIIDLYSVESEIDTNGFTLVAHWYDMPLSLHEVLGSNPRVMQTFYNWDILAYTVLYCNVPTYTGIYLYILVSV